MWQCGRDPWGHPWLSTVPPAPGHATGSSAGALAGPTSATSSTAPWTCTAPHRDCPEGLLPFPAPTRARCFLPQLPRDLCKRASEAVTALHRTPGALGLTGNEMQSPHQGPLHHPCGHGLPLLSLLQPSTLPAQSQGHAPEGQGPPQVAAPGLPRSLEFCVCRPRRHTGPSSKAPSPPHWLCSLHVSGRA